MLNQRHEDRAALLPSFRNHTGAIILSATAAVLGRYEISAATSQGNAVAYVVYRWTGRIEACSPGYDGAVCMEVYPPKYTVPAK